MQSDYRNPYADSVAVEGTLARPSHISWGAILAGAVTALAIVGMLNLLGAGVAGSAVDAAAHASPSGTRFGIGAGLWLLISNLLALAAGGYVAARLSGTSDRTEGVLHGLAMWGACALLSAVLLGSAIGNVMSSTASGVASIVGGLGRGAGAAVSAAGQEVSSRTDTNTAQSAVQSLVQRAQDALNSGGAPSQMTSDQRKAEIGRLVTRRVTAGELSAPDRDRLSELVASEIGISSQDAQARVQEVEQQTKEAVRQAEEKARQAADAAAKAVSLTAFLGFGALLFGAAAAAIGARAGTRAISA